MPRASRGRSLIIKDLDLSNLAYCCRKLALAGLVASVFRVRCMRSWRHFVAGGQAWTTGQRKPR